MFVAVFLLGVVAGVLITMACNICIELVEEEENDERLEKAQ